MWETTGDALFIFFVINIFSLFSHTTSQHNIQTKHNKRILLFQKSNQSERERDIKKKKKNKKSFLYIITYIRGKALQASIVEGLAPLIRAVVHSQVTICRRLRIQYASLHMCGVNQFWIIVFFAAVKPANNILFCIELIQRPESSLRHKLGLTDQSMRSNDDKTRFTCVHRLMTIGHSQNIWRKVPGDVVLHIWQFKFGCSFILNLL